MRADLAHSTSAQFLMYFGNLLLGYVCIKRLGFLDLSLNLEPLCSFLGVLPTYSSLKSAKTRTISKAQYVVSCASFLSFIYSDKSPSP